MRTKYFPKVCLGAATIVCGWVLGVTGVVTYFPVLSLIGIILMAFGGFVFLTNLIHAIAKLISGNNKKPDCQKTGF